MGEATLHYFMDAAERTMSVGDLQAEWLVEHEHAELIEYRPTGIGRALKRYRLHDLTVEEADALVIAQPELRECDFCGEHADWEIRLRSPVEMTIGGLTGPIKRPVFACDICQGLVRSNAKAELIDRLLTTRTEQAIKLGGAVGSHVALLSKERIRDAVGPDVRDFVTQVFAKRNGYPRRVDDDAEADD